MHGYGRVPHATQGFRRRRVVKVSVREQDALAHGAGKSLFYYGDWIKKPGVAIVSCNDGLRPVIMKLEATDEESKIVCERQ